MNLEMSHPKYLIQVWIRALLALTFVAFLTGCWRSANSEETVDISLCAVGVENNYCAPEHIVRKLRLPRKFAPDIPKDIKNFVGGFYLKILNPDDLEKYSPFLAARKRQYQNIADWTSIDASGPETFASFLERSRTNGYISEFPSRAAKDKSQSWVKEGGFRLSRMRPPSASGEVLFPTDILPLDGTHLLASCANDPTLGKPVGCRVYNFVNPSLRVDYSDVVTTPELILETSSEFHKLIDQFTISLSRS